VENFRRKGDREEGEGREKTERGERERGGTETERRERERGGRETERGERERGGGECCIPSGTLMHIAPKYIITSMIEVQSSKQ